MPVSRHVVELVTNPHELYTRDGIQISPIEMFVESGGRKLPADMHNWDRHFKDDDDNAFRKNACAMCRYAALFSPYIVHYIQTGEVTSLSIAVCESCDYEMNLAQSVPTLDLNKDYDSSGRFISEHAQKARDRYINNGILPNKTADMHRCYFCEKYLDDEPDINLYLPIEGDSATYGASNLAKVCQDCFHESGYDLERHYVASDRCVSCFQMYPIDDNELDYRTTLKTFGQHLCPKCYVKNHITDPRSRFIYYPCKVCKESDVLDRSVYLSSNDLPNLYNYTCKKCERRKIQIDDMLSLDNPLGEESISIHWNDDVKVVVYNSRDDHKLFLYVVLYKRPAAGDNMWGIKADCGQERYKSVFDCMSAGLNKCESIWN